MFNRIFAGMVGKTGELDRIMMLLSEGLTSDHKGAALPFPALSPAGEILADKCYYRG
ncbi:hypothetical protein [Kordiimonas sp.]|uniref:hypothetical protein n=1 Tax=Kordiimonas sp. TaxID=1970157 RepID=UPI003A8E6DCE